MTSRPQAVPSPDRARRFGPLPWYVASADFIGLDVDLVDQLIGDLVEECAQHTGRARIFARAWCLGQLVRSLPYLALSTLRRGNPRARLRLTASISIVLLAIAAGAAAMQLRDGPPARLLPDRAQEGDGIVINNILPVAMPMRVVDARGHTLDVHTVRYERVAGDQMTISQAGVLTCVSKGDATVRASLADLVSLINVHCRPVTEIDASSWMDFVPGDAPRAIPFVAIGVDNQAVGDLRGSMQIADSSIARLTNSTVTPRAIGTTMLTVTIGDKRTHIAVVVHEPVTRLDNLTPTQRNVAIMIGMPPHSRVEFPAPRGTMWVKYLPRDGGLTPPTIHFEGPGFCLDGDASRAHWLPTDEYGAYCFAGAGARIVVSRAESGTNSLRGALLIERVAQ